MKNEYNILKDEKHEMAVEMNKMAEEIKSLKGHLKKLNEINLISQARINKGLLHKELLSKDLANLDQLLDKKYKAAFPSFGEVVSMLYFFDISTIFFLKIITYLTHSCSLLLA